MYFRYNGKDSKQWGYDIKSSLTIEKLDSIEGETLKSTNSYVEKAVRIKKVNKFTGDLVHFSKLEIDAINRWLFEEDYRCLQVGLYCYNAVFKRRRLMCSDNGYIDLVVRLTPYALSSKTIHNITVIDNTYTYTDDNGIETTVNQGEKIFTINNKSNVEEVEIYPEISIKLKDDKANIVTIENLTLNNKVVFSELENKECIYINGKNQYMISMVDETRNIYSKFNGVYLNLQKGINEIKISSNGFVNVSMCYQEEFNLEEVWLNE